MLDKLAGIEARFEELNRMMAEGAGDFSKIADLARERAESEPIVNAYREYQGVLRDLVGARELLSDPAMGEMAADEIRTLEERQAELEAQLKLLLVPRDPRDEKSVIFEIRAGTGGEEAGIFAADLFRMYTRYAEDRGWKTEIVYANATGVGGYKEVTFEVRGKGAYSRLKYESGVHRVQRVPVTESAGRIHTSAATVAVLPEADEIDVVVNDNDIRIDIFRSSGPGGQSVNTTDSAVRLTHLPTGIVISCQDEKSQLQNKLKAMRILRSRLYEIEEQKRADALGAARRSQIGSGDRSEKIRTYNFPQSRVTDHRIGMTVYQLDSVLNGALDEFIEELAAHDQAQRLEAMSAELA